MDNQNAQQPIQPQPPKKKKKKGLIIGIIAIVLVIIIGAAAAGGGGNKGTTSSAANTTANVSASGNSWDSKFSVSELQLVDQGSGIYKVTGTLTNKTDKSYSYLQVEINEYDSSGAQVGSTLANINNLEANGTWKFEAITTSDSVKSVKLKDVTGF